MCKRAIWSLVSLFIFLAVAFLCHLATDGFCCNALLSTSFLEKRGFFFKEKSKGKHFSMPYFYLGSGGTCYAFVSQDQKEVVKVFKKHHFFKTKAFEGFLSPFWLYLPPKEEKRRLEKFSRVKKSCEIACSFLQEECGILDWQFTSDETADPLVLVDKLGSLHTLDSSKLFFLVQKKATLAKEYFSTLSEMQAKEAISAIFTLFQSIENKGFCILDPRIETNVGFCASFPILIDTGCLVEMPKEAIKREELRKKYKALNSFYTFLHTLNPRLAKEFEAKKEQWIASKNS